MKRRESAEPINWDSLSPRRQKELMRVAVRIAERETARLRKNFGESALAISPSFRLKGARRAFWLDAEGRPARGRAGTRAASRARRGEWRELVLRVTVLAKWRRDERKENDPERVPRVFSGRIRRGRGYETVHIRTDVDELPQVGLRRRRLETRLAAFPWEMGSVCCLVREADNNALCVLSCNHVLGQLHRTTGGQGSTGVVVNQRDPDCAPVASVGVRRNIAGMYPDSPRPSLDAAIAPVTDPSRVSSTINNRRARGVQFDLTKIGLGLPVLVPGATGSCDGVITAIHSAGYWMELPCAEGPRRFFFRRLFEFATTPSTRRGDSGAGLLDPDDRLVGMLFVGRENSNHAFAMLAADIFDPATFSRGIRLVPDHNP